MLGRDSPDVFETHVYCGQLGPTGGRHGDPVIEPDNGNPVGNRYASFPQGVHRSASKLIATAENGVEFRVGSKEDVARLATPVFAPLSMEW
jgi:hypothetical protein